MQIFEARAESLFVGIRPHSGHEGGQAFRQTRLLLGTRLFLGALLLFLLLGMR